MKTLTKLEPELSTFIIDKLKTEFGRRQLLHYLRDIAGVMVDHGDVAAIAKALRYSGIDLVDK
jgi:hypothetical protein